jgi:hypothetical protein
MVDRAAPIGCPAAPCSAVFAHSHGRGKPAIDANDAAYDSDYGHNQVVPVIKIMFYPKRDRELEVVAHININNTSRL